MNNLHHIHAILGSASHAAQQVEQFIARTAEQGYGEGHFLLACHAAFPVLLTPDMLYKLWLNFQQYNDAEGTLQQIDRIAVSDILQSVLVKEVGTDIFEMQPKVRSALLYCLEQRFPGQNRIEELARFTLQYISKYYWKSDPLLDQTREVQEFNALAYLEPGLAAKKLREAFSKAVQSNVRGDQVRIQTLVDRIEKQYQTLGTQLKTGDKAAFDNLKSYAEGMQAFAKGQLEAAATNFAGNTLPQNTIVGAGKNIATIHVPQKVQEVLSEQKKQQAPSKIVALFIAIDDYKVGSKLKFCISDAKKMLEYLESNIYSQLDNSFTYETLFDADATKANILSSIQKTLHSLRSKDLFLLYLVGTGVQRASFPSLNGKTGFVCFDATPENVLEGVISDTDFRAAVQQYNTNDAFMTLIFDSCNMGAPSWIDLQNPKQVLLAASRVTEETFESEKFKGGIFTQRLHRVLARSIMPVSSLSYRALWLKAYEKINAEYSAQHPQLFGHWAAIMRPFLATDDQQTLKNREDELWEALGITKVGERDRFRKKYQVDGGTDLIKAQERALLLKEEAILQFALPHTNEERRVINNLQQIMERLKIKHHISNLENPS